MLAKGKNIDIITETKIVSGYPNLRKDMDRIRFAYQFCELVNAMVKEGQEQREVFSLLEKALNWLNTTNSLQDEALRRFQIRLLELLGFGLPKELSFESLNDFIEGIIEKKLNAKKAF